MVGSLAAFIILRICSINPICPSVVVVWHQQNYLWKECKFHNAAASTKAHDFCQTKWQMFMFYSSDFCFGSSYLSFLQPKKWEHLSVITALEGLKGWGWRRIPFWFFRQAGVIAHYFVLSPTILTSNHLPLDWEWVNVADGSWSGTCHHAESCMGKWMRVTQVGARGRQDGDGLGMCGGECSRAHSGVPSQKVFTRLKIVQSGSEGRISTALELGWATGRSQPLGCTANLCRHLQVWVNPFLDRINLISIKVSAPICVNLLRLGALFFAWLTPLNAFTDGYLDQPNLGLVDLNVRPAYTPREEQHHTECITLTM